MALWFSPLSGKLALRQRIPGATTAAKPWAVDNIVSLMGNRRNNVPEKEIEAGKQKLFLNSLRNIFCYPQSKCCFRSNDSTSGQTEDHLKKTSQISNVSATMFPILPKVLSFV